MKNAFLVVLFAVAQLAPIEIREWPVPWKGTRPRDPVVDKDNRVWFVGQEGDYVGHLDPDSGQFGRFALPKGTGPHNILITRDGEIWFTGNAAAYIGKLNRDTGAVTKYPITDAEARDPHTLAEAANGDLWFTVQTGSFVGRLEREGGNIHLIKIPTAGSRPYGIVIDPSGRIWFNEFGRNAIGSIDPETSALTEYTLPKGTRDRRIALNGDGGIWYTDYARGMLARLDPKTKEVKEWQTPAGASSLPYALASDDKGRLWLVETGPQPNRLVGFDPTTSRFFTITPIRSGGGNVRNMTFVARTHEIWFGTDSGTIGRARVP